MRVVGSSVLTHCVWVRWLWVWGVGFSWAGGVVGRGCVEGLAGLPVRFRWRSIFLAGRQKGHAGRVRSMGMLRLGVVGAGRWINRRIGEGRVLDEM